MAISYTWSVEDLHRKTNNDAVFAVEIKVTATEGSNTAFITNNLGVANGDPTSSDWVNYADLTEDKCLEWVKSAFTGLESDMQTIAAAALSEKTATPSSAKGKPF
tara:strand:- start:322 stop:636 length:315 start_codon:yes stop_codon:yes gene_type:complete